MITPEIAYPIIEKLVLKFKALSAAERRKINEDATRSNYILPLFAALGWDTADMHEVNPEEKVSRGWVDFSFRLGGVPRFFLETKKASEDLNNPRWVSQALDYAWTKSVPWALLSDFEGLRVFNAEWRVDNPFNAAFLNFDLSSYLSDFDRLWWLSRNETEQGRLNVEAERVGKKAKRLPVSQHLFDDLKQWRTALYKDFKGFNPDISPADVDAAVLRTLDRLIFIRTAEDRQVEQNRLQALVRELKDRNQFGKLSEALGRLFREMDAVYNSELFAPHFSDGLYVTSTTLETIIDGLYERKFIRYNFNAIEADVLGTVYEQYLGAVVTESLQTSSKRPDQPALIPSESLTVEDRKQKRKSQGIYYTPSFVTKHIVRQTVGRHLEEHGFYPNPPRVLDMACGSGSFLIEAFDCLDSYLARQSGHIYGEQEGVQDQMRRMQILTQCIYGVDKDRQAVEVARLNLLLRALHIRDKLPLLTNIYHSDSLQEETWPYFTDSFKVGGFDIIIGNPPYVRFENLPKKDREYYANSGLYKCAYQKFDIFVLFLEKALSLLNEGGRIGFIVPTAILSQTYSMPLRKLLLETCCIENIIDFSGYKVFQDATVETCIIVAKKESNSSITRNNRISVIPKGSYSGEGQLNEKKAINILQHNIEDTPQLMFRLDIVDQVALLINRINTQSVKLGQIYYVSKGIVAYSEDGRKKADFLHRKSININDVPYLEGKDVQRYLINFKELYLDYQPLIMARPTIPAMHESPKILIRAIAKGLIGMYDENKYYVDQKLICCVKYNFLKGQQKVKMPGDFLSSLANFDDRFVLGLINSKLIGYYYNIVLFNGLSILPEDVRRLPIARLDLSNPTEKSAHDEIVQLVKEILALHKDMANSERGFDDLRFSLRQRISQVDDQINHLVYTIYGLTDEEIKLVENI